MTPTQHLSEEYKEKSFTEKSELITLLKRRTLDKMNGVKQPFGMLVPTLRDVIILAGKLGIIPITTKPPVCAAEYADV